MARLITSGLELGTLLSSESTSAPDGQPTGFGITIDTSTPRLGLGAAQTFIPQVSPNNANRTWALTASGTTLFARFYFRMNGIQNIGESIDIFTYNNGPAFTLRYAATSNNNFETTIGNANASSNFIIQPIIGTWVKIEVRLKIGVGATDEFDLYFDDVLHSSLRNVDAGIDVLPTLVSIGPNFSLGGGIAGTNSFSIDDFSLNDDSGSQQNSWCGPGKIVLAVPTSDSAVGTGWTDDNAAVTNLFNSVNKKPPVGIGDTTAGGGGHQIRNATSNANVNYDAVLPAYTSLGVSLEDQITVLVPITATGAPVTTSAKAGTIGLVSNPSIPNIALGAGGTAGAFWSGVAAGTYPTGWKWSYGTTVYNPSVLPGTSPVIRVTQVTASTRIAMVDFLGMYVEFTPVKSTTLPPATPILVKLVRDMGGKLRRLHDNILVPDFQAGPPTFVYVDADTASSVTSIASTESTDFVDTTDTVNGTSSIVSTESAASVDSSTISSVSSVSTTDVAAYTDAITISITSSVSATEIAADIESNTAISVSSVSATEVAADVDANTISSTTIVSSLDTAGFVDANTPASVTGLTSIELYTSYIDRAFVTPLLITLGEKIKLFRLLNDNILGETPQIISVDYLDSATISSATSVSSSEIAAYVDTGTTSSTTTSSATDVLGALELNTIASATSIVTNDVISDVDSSTGAVVTSVITTEIAQYAESATITSNTSESSLEEHDIPDSATVSSQSSVITSDLYTVVDPSTGTTTTSVISLETAQYVDSSTISGTTTLTATDVAAYVDSSTVSSITSISAAELHEIPDTGTVSGTTIITSADITAYVDSSTLSTTTSLAYTEVAAYVDSDAPASTTTVSTSDVYLQAPVPASIQALLIRLARYHRQLKLLGSNTLASPQPSGAVYTESDTISTTTLVVSNDVAAFVDSNTITSKSVPSSSDTVDLVDSLSVTGKTNVSTIDTAAYLDAATANGTTTPSALDTSSYVDSALIFSTTSPQPVEAFGLTEAATVTNTTTPINSDIANYVDSLTAFTLTSVLSTETTDYIDSGTASSFTSISYTEQKVTAPTFIDSATITTTTTLPHTYEYGPIVEISLFGTATQRWNADKTVGRYSVAIDKKWNGTSMIGRYEATSKHRWEV